MRRVFFGVAALFVGVAAGAAQPPTLPGPGGNSFGVSGGSSNGYNRLLLNKAVQKDLELTDRQVTAVTDLGRDNSKKYLAAAKAIDKALPPKDKITKRAELREKFDKEYHEGLSRHLLAGQIKRLGQIRLQADAPGSLAWPAVAEKLNLTAEQKKQVEKLVRDLNADRLNVMTKESADAVGNPEKTKALNAKLDELGRKAAADGVNLLDEKQKKTWKELTGKGFDTSKLGLGGLLGD